MLRPTVALLAVLALASAPASAAPASHRATRATFTGTWIGHTRFLKITRHGRARESVGDGCCHPIVDLRFRLSRVRGTTRRASARMRVTAVTVHDPSAFDHAHPAPKVGDIHRLRLRNDVITDPATGQIYCGPRAERRGLCGA